MRVTIEKLVYGGAGMVRTEHGVVFVPKTLPGEVAEVQIVERKKDYAVGKVVEIVARSADRREPVCPNYETVGCCHWQHIAYEKQVEFKETILRESLERLGKIRWDGPINKIVGPDRNYRLRATFHVKDGKLGFVEESTNKVVPIRECSALAPELNRFLQEASPITTLKRVNVVATPFATVHGLRYRLNPKTFFQSNRFLLDAFVSEVLRVSASPRFILDLYCGSGFFSLPLARVAERVIGVDRIPPRDARENARRNRIPNVEFVRADVDQFLSRCALRPEVVLLNPPRSGAGRRNIERIVKFKPERIVYVSCNPTTFAPEAAMLGVKGYELRRLTLLDQFPHTYHIETIAMFGRG